MNRTKYNKIIFSSDNFGMNFLSFHLYIKYMGEELTCFVQKLSQMELEGYAPSTLPCKGSVFLTIPKPQI